MPNLRADPPRSRPHTFSSASVSTTSRFCLLCCSNAPVGAPSISWASMRRLPSPRRRLSAHNQVTYGDLREGRGDDPLVSRSRPDPTLGINDFELHRRRRRAGPLDRRRVIMAVDRLNGRRGGRAWRHGEAKAPARIFRDSEHPHPLRPDAVWPGEPGEAVWRCE